jgi:hypothetical protein
MKQNKYLCCPHERTDEKCRITLPALGRRVLPPGTPRTAVPRVGGAAVSSVPFPPGSAPFPARSSGLSGSRPRPLLARSSQPLEPDHRIQRSCIRLSKLSPGQQICYFSPQKVSLCQIYICVFKVCKFLQTRKYVFPMHQSFSRLTNVCI